MDIHNQEPSWGLDGTSPELKEHILCCEDHTEDEDGGVLKGDDEDDEEDGPKIGTAPSDGGDDGGDKLAHMVIGIQKPKAETETPDSSNNEDDTASQQPGDDNDSSSTVVEPFSYMTAPEMLIQNEFRPAWFNTEFGWQGTTYNDARAFCESIPHGDGGTLHLCPLEAYCPNGPRDTEPLYLQMDAFDGVQWAPYAIAPPTGNNEAPIENVWVMIGNIGDGAMTCQPYVEINHRDPAWGLDGTSPELKEHILCCEDNTGNDAQDPITTPSDGGGGGDDEGEKLTNPSVGIIQQGSESFASTDNINSGNSDGDSSASSNSQEVTVFESSITNTFNPMWFNVDRGGWDGGSHDDAIQFCEQFVGTYGKRMELPPYAAYCPSGPSKSPIGGHTADFNEEGEQWAPVFGKSNHWVLIGKRGQNSATSCLSHVQLNGEEPSWGLDGSNKEMTKYVLCCSPLQ